MKYLYYAIIAYLFIVCISGHRSNQELRELQKDECRTSIELLELQIKGVR